MRGERQLAEYLKDYGLQTGYLLSFNFNQKKEIGVREIEVEGKRIIEAKVSCCVNRVRLLLGKHETFEIRKTAVSLVSAPVFSGETAGAVEYLVEGQVLYRYPIVFSEDVGAADYSYYFRKVLGACGS